MDIIKSKAEAAALCEDSMRGAWEQYRKEFIDTLPGMTPYMKSFLKLVFTHGYQRGMAFVSTYMAGVMLQSQLEAIIGKQFPVDETPKSSEPKESIDDLIRKLEDLMMRGPSDPNLPLN